MATENPVGEFPLKDKIAVVTGGGSGINLSFARLAAARGGKVIIADIRLTKEAEEYVSAASNVIFQKCDVTVWADLENVIAVSEKEFGDVPDVYVPGAGIFEPSWSGFWDDTELERYAQVDINISHPIKFTRMAVRALLGKNKQGVILITASMAGYISMYRTPLYCATKHAMVGFTRSLADADRFQGVKVVAICPGLVRTPLLTNRPDLMYEYAVDEQPVLSPDEVAESMMSLVEDSKYGGGTCLEITAMDGTRVIPAFNIDPPTMIKRAGAMPRDATHRLYAPTIQRLKGERGVKDQ